MHIHTSATAQGTRASGGRGHRHTLQLKEGQRGETILFIQISTSIHAPSSVKHQLIVCRCLSESELYAEVHGCVISQIEQIALSCRLGSHSAVLRRRPCLLHRLGGLLLPQRGLFTVNCRRLCNISHSLVAGMVCGLLVLTGEPALEAAWRGQQPRGA